MAEGDCGVGVVDVCHDLQMQYSLSGWSKSETGGEREALGFSNFGDLAKREASYLRA